MWSLAYLLVSPFIAVALAKGDCGAKLDQCLGRASRRPVCGTDNKTYPTRCHLLRTKCNTMPYLAVKHRGKCSEKQSCWTDELRRSGAGSVGGAAVFVPKCLPDGSYAPVQCHEGTGFCWCVTATGKPIADTAVRHSKPICNRKGKGNRKTTSHRGRKHRKDCGRIERSNFLANLLIFFRDEFNSSLTTPMNSTEEEFTTSTLNWKFSNLDLDKNNTLSRAEYKELRKHIKKIAKPRKCARSFVRICDVDRDMFISHEEWTSCLNVEIDTERKTGPRRKKIDGWELGVLKGSPITIEDGIPNIPMIDEDSDKPDSESEVTDCLTDRKGALEEQKPGSSETYYVPECSIDGRYQKIQCFKSTGYCWCVHEDTGKPIPGTSVKGVNPQCDAVQTPSRPMKGCPEHSKQVFLRDLMEFLAHRISTRKPRIDPSTIQIFETENEKIATLNFYDLDVNRNKVLERKEWKAFRTMISNHKKLRRCGKKFPRYCDVNYDRKISLTEWLNCLETQRVSLQVVQTSPLPSPRKNIGFGPLDLLKEYD